MLNRDFSSQRLQQHATTWLTRIERGCTTYIESIDKTTATTAIASVAIIMALLLIGSLLPLPPATPQMQHEELTVSLPDSLADTAGKHKEQQTTIHRGDSASSALHRLGFSSRDVLAMAAAAKNLYPLTHVVPGQRLIRIEGDGSNQLRMAIDPLHTLYITEHHGEWQSSIKERATTSRRIVRSGTINNNFFLDASRAGLSDRTIVNLAYIFGWDIDFARNLRRGDHFSVLLEMRYSHQGEALNTTILAAIFINRGKTFRAIRFTNRHGETLYYAPDGSNMRKNFLKAPVKFTRISSRFKLARKHPVLGYTRAHRGIDYAAPIGTPVHAIGAGTIVYLGRRGGYGRLIAIRHRNRHHETRYAHMSRYAKGLHRGSRVKQGQIIGFVGMSGLATGPHLHFEFRVDGRAINPLHIKRVPAEPISRSLRAKFEERSQKLLRALQQPQPTTVAWQ
ncbi:MAG: peptidoglycan DD-metalloendopeptidase family protein [Mariprofundales bacterium]|nr:peptidoglycan DD-metalloendopeptidase family protein [Mariprofundales bacterium]